MGYADFEVARDNAAFELKMITCEYCDVKSPEECQLCRDADTQNHDIIHIQNVLENAGVSDPAVIEKIIKGLTWKK